MHACAGEAPAVDACAGRKAWVGPGQLHRGGMPGAVAAACRCLPYRRGQEAERSAAGHGSALCQVPVTASGPESGSRSTGRPQGEEGLLRSHHVRLRGLCPAQLRGRLPGGWRQR